MEPPRIDVSIAIISHEHWSDLRDNLPLVLDDIDGCSYELWVVDNAADGTAAHVARDFPSARVILNPRPLGFAANCNQVIRRASGRYVLLLNPDVRCHPGAIQALVRFMDEHPEAGLAAPKLLNPDGTIQLSCRQFSTPLVIAVRGLGLESRLERNPAHRRALMQDWDHSTVRDVDWAMGAALMARREAIEDVGPLDPGYYLYREDEDWCYRMWAGGWSVYYVPDSVMTHAHRRASYHRPFSRWKWIHAQSALRMFRKQGISGRRPSPAAPRARRLERTG